MLVELTVGSSKLLTQLRGLARALPDLSQASESPPGPCTRPVQRRLTPDQVAQLCGVSGRRHMSELAKRWGVHRTTVAGHLRRAGVEVRRQGLSEEQLDEAVQLYIKDWSLQRLAERYGCDVETVRSNLKDTAARMRKPWERN